MKLWGRGNDKAETVRGRFQSAGWSLAFETQGVGEPVLLVHGFASSLATNWKTPGILGALAEAGFSAAALDLRGHGGSDRPHVPGAYSLDAMAGDVERFIAYLGIERPHVVGYSMGSRILLRLLTARPDLARSAVLGGIGNAIGEAIGPWREEIAEALLAPDPGEIASRTGRRFRLFAESQGNDLAALAQCIREAIEPIDTALLPRITVPVLVLAGAEDDQIADPQGLARRIPGARAEIIGNRNHMTIIGDARFRQAILGFLKGQS
jgi:pimeloyl-ACP methyl ester carboxylesterase